MHAVRFAAALLLTVPVAALQACSTGCDDATIQQAVAFIDAHQICATNDDCRVVAAGCAEIPGGLCGQHAMNRQGAESAEWASIAHELDDCSPDSCEVCAAALIPTCTNGCCTDGKCGS